MDTPRKAQRTKGNICFQSIIYIYGNFEGSKEGSYGETGSLERNLLLQGHLPLNRDQRKWYCNYCWELKKRGKKKWWQSGRQRKKIDNWSLPLDLVQDFGHERFLSHTYHHICGPVSDQNVWILNHWIWLDLTMTLHLEPASTSGNISSCEVPYVSPELLAFWLGCTWRIIPWLVSGW